MTKASLQKQTIFTLFFLALFFLPNLLSAQNYSCEELIEEVTSNYMAPPDSAIEPICEYTDVIYSNTSKICETPQSVTYAFFRDSVEINWEHDPLSGDTYQIDYINTTTGLSGSTTVNTPPTTIDNLTPGIYVFALRRICKKGVLSDPVLFTGIIGPIIVDVIGALTAPQYPAICQCPVYAQQAPLLVAHTSGVSVFQWVEPPSGCNEKYNIKFKVYYQGAFLNVNMKFRRRDGFIRVGQCYNNDDFALEPVPSNNTFGPNDEAILEFRKQDVNHHLLFTLTLSDDELTFTPATNISGQDYTMTINSCCPLDDDNTGGNGSKQGGSNNGQEFNEEEGNSNSRSSGIYIDEAMKATLLSAPNPFTNATTINYTLPMDSELSLNLYNAIGQQVRELKQGFQAAGTYQIPLRGEDLQAGLYYLRLKTKTQDELVKMVKL